MNARKIRIRTKKIDSAYVYHTLEASEGLTAYRTLPHREGEDTRDVELLYVPESEKDVLDLMEELKGKFWLEIVSED